MPSGFEVVRSDPCDLDLELIFDHLFAAYRDLGDSAEDALLRAERRLQGIEDALERLSDVPHQGTLAPRIMDGLRHVTKDNVVFCFIVDDAERSHRVLGVFFGGQDHRGPVFHRIAGAQLRKG